MEDSREIIIDLIIIIAAATGGGVLDSTHHFGLSFAWGGEAQ